MTPESRQTLARRVQAPYIRRVGAVGTIRGGTVAGMTSSDRTRGDRDSGADRAAALSVAKYRLRTLGRLALLDRDGREEHSLGTRPRKLALLAWLAMRPERRATRDLIIGVFWGEREAERARNSLSDALSHFRRVLGRNAIRTPADEVVIAEDAPLAVDGIDLARAVATGDHDTVIALHKGVFLDGIFIDDAPEFDDWRDRERARISAHFGKSCSARCEELARSNDWTRCEETARRWLDVQGESMEAIHWLLTAVAAPGTRDAYVVAMREYGAFTERGERDLGLQPDPALVRIRDEIAAALANPSTPSAAIVAGLPAPKIAPRPPDETPAQSRDASDRVTAQRPRLSSRLIAFGAGAIAVTATVFVMLQQRTAGRAAKGRVAVATFENRTGDTSVALIGRMAADWISRGLAETRILEVVNPVAAPSASGPIDVRSFGEDVNARTIVVGSYIGRGDSIEFEARLVDASSNRLIRAIGPVTAHRGSPMLAIGILRQRVAGALAAENDRVITALAREATQPPTYDAYLAWVDGLDAFSQGDMIGSIPILLRAASLDTNFVTPMLWAAAAYANSGRWAQCDSIIGIVDRRHRALAPIDRGLLNLWKSLLRGDKAGAYAAAKLMLAEAPGSEGALYLAGLNAMEVNRPAEAVSVLRRIPVQRSGVKWDLFGTGLTRALHMTERHSEELAEARRRRSREPKWLGALEAAGTALVAVGRLDEIDGLVSEIAMLSPQPGRTAPGSLSLIADELQAHGYAAEAVSLFRQVIELARAMAFADANAVGTRVLVARALFLTGDTASAEAQLRVLSNEAPSNPAILGWMGVMAAARGRTAEADSLSNALSQLNYPYVLGAHLFERARIAAVLGRKDNAVALLRQALAQGVSIFLIHWSPELQSLRGYPPFETLMKPVG